MTTGDIVGWSIAIVLTYAAAGMAIIAIRRGRPLLALPSIAPVASILVAAALAPAAMPLPSPVFPVLLGGGLAVIGVAAGNPLVGLLLALSSRGDTQLGSHGGILVRDRDSPLPERAREREILRGGTSIGYLERFALIGSVVVGQSAAVALIVAVKGLGRFSELENERARERFIIGTLASLTWAGCCAVAILVLN